MKNIELDQLDSAIAGIEGPGIAILGLVGEALRLDQTPYRPTRDGDEALRLLEKYVTRTKKLADGWAAIGPSGRACIGPTLSIAVCRAVIEEQ
jgi:hypothetical protein